VEVLPPDAGTAAGAGAVAPSAPAGPR